MRWIVPCPAKLNLFLSVGPIDERGFHPLRSIFQAVGLFDTLVVEPAERNEVVCAHAEVPANNTVSKTLRLLAEVVTLPPLRVILDKQIPAQSGLGGGSSDAAGLIRAAAVIAGGPMPQAETQGLALTVGADVPFFLVGGRARAEGYGERLEALPDPAPEWYVLAKPHEGSDTAQAFRRLDQANLDWRPFPTSDALYNDFERVALCGSLDLIDRLRVHGASDAALTGSGSAVFGRFADASSADSAAEALRRESVPFVKACRSLTREESLQVWFEP